MPLPSVSFMRLVPHRLPPFSHHHHHAHIPHSSHLKTVSLYAADRARKALQPDPHQLRYLGSTSNTSPQPQSATPTAKKKKPAASIPQHQRSPTEPLGTEEGPNFDDDTVQPFAASHTSSTTPSHFAPLFRKQNTDQTSRQKVVVLGTGWASYMFVRAIDRHKYDVYVVSPRNHFLFTPLLASTTTGTLEYRSVIEPIRRVSDISFFEAYADKIDFDQQLVQVRDAFDGKEFQLQYDSLVIGVGSHNATFGVPGVREHANFLKNVRDSQAIRNKILSRFEQATSPLIDDEERRNLLRVITVGGGPTSVEFAAELYDFIDADCKRAFPSVAHLTEIIVVEATDHLLSAFDKKLSSYVTSLYRQRPGMKVFTGTSVKEVKADSVELNNGSELRCGAVVWSTGLQANPFILRLPLLHQPRSQRLSVNEHLQVRRATKHGEGREAKETAGDVIPSVFAFGDCGVIEIKNHPPTAQVAAAEAGYLAKRFNNYGIPSTATADEEQNVPVFAYRSYGQLAYIGGRQALADLPLGDKGKLTGFAAYVFWRSAYVSKLMSWKNRVMVVTNWMTAKLFGRDIARF